MNVASGETIYVEARTDRKINLEVQYDGAIISPVLTTEEARTLANALLAAVAEDEAHHPPAVTDHEFKPADRSGEDMCTYSWRVESERTYCQRPYRDHKRWR